MGFWTRERFARWVLHPPPPHQRKGTELGKDDIQIGIVEDDKKHGESEDLVAVLGVETCDFFLVFEESSLLVTCGEEVVFFALFWVLVG